MFFSSRLATKLSEAKSADAKPPVTQCVSSASAGNASRVAYQLFYRPEQAKFSSNARVRKFHIK